MAISGISQISEKLSAVSGIYEKMPVAGCNFLVNLANPEEGVLMERCTERGYERNMRENLLHSNAIQDLFL